MKSSLLFSASLAVLSLVPFAKADVPVYISAYGGADFSDDWSGEGPWASFSVGTSGGYVVGGILGVKIAQIPGLSLELDVNHRHNSLSGEFNGCDTFPLSGADNTFGVLANARYSFEGPWGTRPYILAGAGYAHRRIALNPAPSNFALNGGGAEESGVAWQLGTGVEVSVAKDISLGVGYIYFQGPQIDRLAIFGKDSTFFEAPNEHHAVVASATFSF